VAYKFRLQKVLDWRLRLEEEQNCRLGQAYREAAEAKGELGRLKEYLGQLQADYSLRQLSQVDVPGALLAADYLTCLFSRVREQQQAVAQCEQRLAEQLRLAEKALQERKVMDTLREKEVARCRREAEAVEQRLTDEAARFVYLYGRQF